MFMLTCRSRLAACLLAALLAAVCRPAAADDGAKAASAPQKQQPAPKAVAPMDLGALMRMHYDNRVRSFREQNAVYRNVVLLGDSITEGFDVPTYFPGRRVINRGIGGDVIGNALPEEDHRGVLRRLDESVFHSAATDVFLMIGINDLGSGREPEVMAEGYRDLLQQLKSQAPLVRVHVQSLLPTRGEFAKHNAPVLDFNQRIKKLAEEFGYDYLDIHRLMADDQGELKAEYTGDGLHLNAEAYKQWQSEIERVMGWE
jgi:lysophospholipase L1-like esterase